MIDRRVLPNGEVEEWERYPTIPDDFIYDPEVDGYYPPGEPVDWDLAAEMREFEEARRRGEFKGGLISRDQLIAAGAIVPREKKKKSSGVQRGLLFDLSADDKAATAEQTSEEDESE